VAVTSPDAARRMRRAVGLPDRHGLLVRCVRPGSAAERAGVEPGDLLVSADGLELDGLEALYGALEGQPPARPLALTVLRGSEQHELSVAFEDAQEDR
jgi:S1-C subfamily serine protease